MFYNYVYSQQPSYLMEFEYNCQFMTVCTFKQKRLCDPSKVKPTSHSELTLKTQRKNSTAKTLQQIKPTHKVTDINTVAYSFSYHMFAQPK